MYVYVVASVCWSIFNKLCRKVLFIRTLVHNTYTSSSCSYTHTHTHSSKLADMHSYILKRKNKNKNKAFRCHLLSALKCIYTAACICSVRMQYIYMCVCVRTFSSPVTRADSPFEHLSVVADAISGSHAFLLSPLRLLPDSPPAGTHTHTRTRLTAHILLYLYKFMCMCMCAHVLIAAMLLSSALIFLVIMVRQGQ